MYKTIIAMQEVFPRWEKSNIMGLNSVMILIHVANPHVHVTADTFQPAQK